MAKAKTQIEVQEVTLEWMRIASEVAQGLLAPQEGVAMLRALAEAYPADNDWLHEEVETIRFQFGLDINDRIRKNEGSYWEKLLAVVEALLEEKMDHAQALELLVLIDAQHPENMEQTNALISDIEDSPLRQYLEMAE